MRKVGLLKWIKNTEVEVYVNIAVSDRDMVDFFTERGYEDDFIQEWEDSFDDSDVIGLEKWLVNNNRKFTIEDVEYAS